MSDDTVNALIALIVRELNIEPSKVKADTALFEGGLDLDSFAVVELIGMIEAEFSMQFSDDDFHPENFTDVRTLAGVVTRIASG